MEVAQNLQMGHKYISKSEKRIWTPEQLNKISKLRESAAVAKTMKPHIITPGEPFEKKTFKVTDKVMHQGHRGVVTKRELSESGAYVYEMKSRDRVFEGLHYSDMTPFVKDDLSHIEIPEDIKGMKTEAILAQYRTLRVNGDTRSMRGMQLKAELNNRPHVPNKKERQVERKKSKNKNKY